MLGILKRNLYEFDRCRQEDHQFGVTVRHSFSQVTLKRSEDLNSCTSYVCNQGPHTHPVLLTQPTILSGFGKFPFTEHLLFLSVKPFYKLSSLFFYKHYSAGQLTRKKCSIITLMFPF